MLAEQMRVYIYKDSKGRTFYTALQDRVCQIRKLKT